MDSTTPPPEDLVASLSELAVPLPETGALTPRDLPEGLRSRLEAASVVGLGESSHGTQEFYDLRARLTRLLVEAFGVRAVGFEAPFHPFCRIDDRVAAGSGEVRPILAGLDGYRPMRAEPLAELFEWLRSFNASRPAGDRVRVYGYDMTVIRDAAVGIEPYLDAVGADVDPSLREALGRMTAGYDSEEERRAVLAATRAATESLEPMVEANEAAWVEAESRREYERVRHRLDLLEGQLEAHARDHEGRMALRDRTMADTVEWIAGRSTGPVALWGHNGHLNRARHVLEEWDVDVPSMGEQLDAALGEGYCPVGLETGGGRVAATDFAAGETAEYPIPDPPSGSVPAVLGQVDGPLFCLSTEALYADPTVREWLGTGPRRHDIWGGKPDGGSPVNYLVSELTTFDWLVFVRDSSPLAHLD